MFDAELETRAHPEVRQLHEPDHILGSFALLCACIGTAPGLQCSNPWLGEARPGQALNVLVVNPILIINEYVSTVCILEFIELFNFYDKSVFSST